ncbi:MAG: hypothetical protein ACKPBT_07255 [Microcystis aeruginosa]
MAYHYYRITTQKSYIYHWVRSQLSVISYQLSVISYQLSVISYQLSVMALRFVLCNGRGL